MGFPYTYAQFPMSHLPRALYDGTASCATCVLWKETDQGDLDPRDIRYGHCHADPPRMNGMRTMTEWPRTVGTDFCGKFAPAGAAELERRR